ncbi:MAG TPA: prolyl oligopeptidase family serine peptidase [Candidatus Baltobacteraceae bacterium]
MCTFGIRLRVFAMLVSVCVLAILPRDAVASTRQFALSDILRNEQISSVVISPNGRYAAIVRVRSHDAFGHFGGPDNAADLNRSEIWLFDRDRWQLRKIIASADGFGYWQPHWSPDSERLAVLTSEGGGVAVHLCIWERQTGELTRIGRDGFDGNFALAIGESKSNVAWVDATHVLAEFLPAGEEDRIYSEGEDSLGPLTRKRWLITDSGRFPSVNVLQSGTPLPETRRPQGSLVTIDVTTGQINLLTRANIRAAAISPDRRWVAVIADNGRRRLRPDELLDYSDLFDGYTGGNFETSLFVHRRIGVVHLDGQAPVKWVKSQYTDPFFLDIMRWRNGRVNFAASVKRGRPVVLSLGINGVVKRSAGSLPRDLNYLRPTTYWRMTPPCREMDRSASTGFSLSLCVTTHGTILRAKRDAKSAWSQILAINQHLQSVAVPVLKYVPYTDADGHEVLARLLQAARAASASPRALVVAVYPVTKPVTRGDFNIAREMNSSGWYTDLLFASHGYTVLLYPPVKPWTHEPLAACVRAVLPAVKAVIRAEHIDKSRVFLFGHSQGGYETMGLLTKTKIFRAAAASNGSSDSTLEYLTFGGPTRYFENYERMLTIMPDMERGWDSMSLDATPWTNPGRYVRNSPIYWSGNISTPLLMLQGEMDDFNSAHLDMMFQALLRQGKRAELARYWGDGHNFESPADIRDLWNRVFRWFSVK